MVSVRKMLLLLSSTFKDLVVIESGANKMEDE
jgi:hypothetical protein